MIGRIIRFLFAKPRHILCEDCWLRGKCAAYLATGVTYYLPEECPNNPKAPLSANLHLPRDPF